MNHKQPIRPAIYVRASGDGRVGTGAIASQVDALRARIRQDDLVLEGPFCFIDGGASGISSHRPALDRLRDQAAMGTVDRIYVHSPNRLAMNRDDYILIYNEFQHFGVEIVFIDQAPQDGPVEKPL
jgi:site-specific DNA recombinase